MIVEDYLKFNVYFWVGMPVPITNFKGTLVPLPQILQAIESTDASFPLTGYHHNQRRWMAASDCYDKSMKAFMWYGCVFTYHSFVTLFRQGGWDVPVTYWESIENDTVVKADDNKVTELGDDTPPTPPEEPPAPHNYIANDDRPTRWSDWHGQHDLSGWN